MKEIVVGSRGSELALRQAHWVVSRIIEAYPDISCRIEVIKTTGDRIIDSPLAAIGDKGLFVKEIELALINGEIDIAVHSAKDLPSDMDERLSIAAYTEREDPRDALVSKSGKLSELPIGASVGTSSARRRAQILHYRPDLNIRDLRGNLDTRLRKLCGPDYDAIILACAGLRRMNLESRISEAIPMNISIPAAGQGALAVQCRAGEHIADILSSLDHPQTRRCVCSERTVIAALEAGCRTPVGVNGRESDDIIALDAMVASVDGSRMIRKSLSGSADDWEDIGRRMADELRDAGAEDLLEEARYGATNDIGAAG
ncbi:hydroxymethylbilane synthase [bacterium]|nr:hydroxymethylbilane synthase [bacterium]